MDPSYLHSAFCLFSSSPRRWTWPLSCPAYACLGGVFGDMVCVLGNRRILAIVHGIRRLWFCFHHSIEAGSEIISRIPLAYSWTYVFSKTRHTDGACDPDFHLYERPSAPWKICSLRSATRSWVTLRVRSRRRQLTFRLSAVSRTLWRPSGARRTRILFCWIDAIQCVPWPGSRLHGHGLQISSQWSLC